MRKLLIVRHAQTDMAGTFCGHSDPSLNAAGRGQVQVMLPSLPTGSFDAIYTSDLRRARETATLIADQLAVPIVEVPALREIHFGAWEGLTWKQVEAFAANYAARWMAGYPNVPAPGGEAFSHFQTRVLGALDTLIAETPYERVLVITHAGVMRAILTARCEVSDGDAWTQTREYCSTFRYPVAGEVEP